jgi:hypothetical protein
MNGFALPRLALQAHRAGATRRLASSWVAPVYASASSYTLSCIIFNANAYRVSRSDGRGLLAG